jgi:hypothetical protein
MVMAKTYKTADAARAAYKPKRGLPKGGGKGAKGERLYTPVSQATIDKIKKMGMTKALAVAGKTPKGARAEFIQGVNRMYGAKRVAAARAKAAPAAKSPDAARAAYANKPAVKKAAVKKAAPKKYTSKSPKPMNPKGLFPGLLGGKK